jgi:5'-nucleotidase
MSSGVRFLITNDDGIEAPGLQALIEAVDGAGSTIVVAPSDAKSGCAHAATTDRPFRLRRLGTNRYAVEGTPADCVRVGMHGFPSEVEWVLAGINSGGNLGVDVYHSGTVAAAREAALRGIPAIAISHYRDRPLTGEDWNRAAEWTRYLLQDLLGRSREKGVFWNINLPALAPQAGRPDVVFCPLDPSPLPLSFNGDGEMLLYDGVYARRERQQGSDVDVCFGGKIAVTQVRVMEASR